MNSSNKLKKLTQHIRAHLHVYAYPIILSQLMISSSAFAGPTGENIVGGAGHINRSGLNTNIHQHTNRLAIDWNTFNVERNESVNFDQPNRSSIVLNRILDINPSQIQGAINANGRVVIANPNGVLFGPTASVNVGGLFAAAMTINPDDFMNGNLNFEALDNTGGLIANEGTLKVLDGGVIALLGQKVKNSGLLVARFGTVFLASGGTISVTFDEYDNVSVGVKQQRLADILELDSPDILNEGLIQAFGGRVVLTTKQADDIKSSINPIDESQRASQFIIQDGVVYLTGSDGRISDLGGIDVSNETGDAGSVTYEANNIEHSGTLNADSQNGNGGTINFNADDTTLLTDNSTISAQSNKNGTGGTVQVLGNQVGLTDSTSINASGTNGGGEVLIGGDYQGKNENIKNAEAVYLGANTTIKADATKNGNGGKVIVWSDDRTRAYNSLSATGGKESGNGGLIETSSKNYVDLQTSIDVSASNGLNGEWLIDPASLMITNTAISSGLSQTPPPDIEFISTNNVSTLNINDLQNTLAAGANITIQTSVIGNPDLNPETSTVANNSYGDITLAVNLDYDNAGNTRDAQNASSLTLRAHRNIIINGQIFDSDGDNTPQTGPNQNFTPDGDILNLTLVADWGGNGGANQAGTPGIGSVRINNDIDLQGGNFTASGVDFVQAANTTIDTRIPPLTPDSGFVLTDERIFPVDPITPNGDVSITMQGSTTLANIITRDTTGGLSVTANNGTITQANATNTLLISDTTALSASGNITLNNPNNNFNGNVIINNGAVVSLADTDNLNLNINNTLTSIAADTAGDLNITDISATPTVLDTLVVGANLDITAAGGITQTATGTVTINNNGTGDGDGISTLRVNNARSILLGRANALNGTLNFIANSGNIANFTLRTNNAFNLQDGLNINGALNLNAQSITLNSFTLGTNATLRLTANGGNLEQTAAINHTGRTVLSASGDINFTQANNFNNIQIDNAGTATINNGANALLLRNTINVSNLDITATGGISENATITVTGTATFDAGSNALMLSNNRHDLNNLQITSAGNVRVREEDDINIAGTMGSLDVYTGWDSFNNTDTISNITDTTLNVSGTSVFRFRDSDSILNLNNFSANNTTQNDLQGLITLTQNSGSFNNISLRNTSNIELAALDISGTLNLDSTGTLSQTGAFNVTGNSTLQGSSILLALDNDFDTVNINSAGSVTLNDLNDIQLQGTVDSLNVTSGLNGNFSTIANVNNNALNVTNTSSFTLANGGDIDLNNNALNNLQGAITISATFDTLNNVDINNNSGVALSLSDTIQSDLTIASMGAITQGSNFTVTGLTSLNSGNNLITLALNNNFNQVDVSNASTVTLNDINGGITVTANNVSGTLGIDANGLITVSGDAGALDITTSAGGIADNAALTISGSTLLDAATSDINFDNTSNSLTDITITRANAVTINNQGDILIAGTMNSATLASGLNGASSTIANINGSSLNISGAANLTLFNGGDVNLNNNAVNDIQGLITITPTSGTINNVDINNASGVQLAGMSIQNTLDIQANGLINQSGALTVNGNTTLDSNNNVIDFSLNNNFTSVSASNALDVFLTDIDAIDVTAINNIGTLTINAETGVTLAANVSTLNVTTNTGNIVDSAPISVTGIATLTASNSDIVFDNNNSFNNATITQANNAQLNDVDAINVIATNINNTLTVSAGNTLNLMGTMGSLNASTLTGNIEDSGQLTVLGNSILDAGISDIIFNDASNNLNTVTITNAANATLTDTNAIAVTAMNISNNLTINAGNTVSVNGAMASLDVTTLAGGIIDNGILTVSNATTLDAGGSPINFANNLHDFNNVNIANASTVNITEANAINISASNVSATLTVDAGNTVTISGDMNGLNITSANGGIQDGGNQISVAALTTLDAANSDINFNTIGNDFNQFEITQARDVTLLETNQLQMLNTSVRDLSVTTGGDLTQLTGTAIVSTGLSQLDSGASNINLMENNQFTTLALNANVANVVNDQALILNDSVLTDSLSVTTNNGDLSINQINAPNEVTLTAANGALLDANDEATNIIANNAILQAANGIGTGSSIDVQLAQLSALNTASGDININNSGGDITLNNITNMATDTGNFNFRTIDDVFIDNITLQQNLVEDFFISGNGTGTANIFSFSGSFLGVGSPNINDPDITATNLRVFAVRGTLGRIQRNMVLDISGKVEITTLARLDLIYVPPVPVPDDDIRETATVDLTSSSTLGAINGLTLTEVENLLDINPAIFTDLRHFVVGADPVLLPKDQWFDDGYTDEEDEEYFRSIIGEDEQSN